MKVVTICGSMKFKDKMMEIIKEIDKLDVEAPISLHQVVIKNVLNLGIDIIATKEIEKDE